MVANARPALRQDSRPDGVYTRDDHHGDSVLDADVVIVGSGAGGAALAAELAEGGLDVVVLEEGRYWSTRDFTANASQMIRQMYRDGGATMALGSPPVLYQEGRAVGGSTVVNGGMSWRTPEKILDRWWREAGLDGIRAADMEPYFERVERRIHVRTQDPESIGRDNQLLKIGADAKGWKVIPNLRNQVHCPGSNNCAFGCPTGAKQSALVSYVPRALHFGARLYSDVRVERITRSGKRATGVVGHVVRADGGRGHRLTVRAKLVVSACGAIHSPALLDRSGFRSPSGMVGKNLSLHPNVKLVAIFDEDVRGWEGVHQAYQVREALETLAIRLAVPNLSDEDLDRIDDIVTRQAEAVERDDIARFFALNSEFHQLFVDQSHNAPLQDMYRQLIGHMGRYLMRSLALRGTVRRSIAEHRAIARACRTRDPERAERLLRNHIRVPQRRLEAANNEEVLLKR